MNHFRLPAYAICPLCRQAHGTSPPVTRSRRRSRSRVTVVRVRDGERMVRIPVKR